MTLECNKCGFKSPQGSDFCGSCGEDTEFRVEKMARNAALAAEAAATAAAEAARVAAAVARDAALIPVERHFDNGQLQMKGYQKEGKWHGPFARYHENGQILEKGTYNMSERCGEWIQERSTGFLGGKTTTVTVTHPPC
jgi:hypothetical protein